MTPSEQSILKTLNLLTLIYRAQKQNFPKLTDEQQHTLQITKEHLATAEISIPVFINVLQTLGKKGYLDAVSVFENKYHEEIPKFFEEKSYAKSLEVIEGSGKNILTKDQKEAIADSIEKTMPPGHSFDRESFLNEEVKMTDMIEESRPYMENHTKDNISTIVLMPYRSIDRLLEKMNSGVKLDDVKDPGIWYENEEGLLHFDEQSISTEHNRKRYAHYAFQALFAELGNAEIDYVNIPEFDDTQGKAKELKSFRDSLATFIKKHPRLEEIFTVHSTYLEIHEEY